MLSLDDVNKRDGADQSLTDSQSVFILSLSLWFPLCGTSLLYYDLSEIEIDYESNFHSEEL